MNARDDAAGNGLRGCAGARTGAGVVAGEEALDVGAGQGGGGGVGLDADADGVALADRRLVLAAAGAQPRRWARGLPGWLWL